MRAASATPCAWLPADEQTTPRFFSASDICANLLSGPRILYEPTRWKFSALRRMSYPVASLSWRDVSSGVRVMCSAIRARASSKSFRLSVSILVSGRGVKIVSLATVGHFTKGRPMLLMNVSFSLTSSAAFPRIDLSDKRLQQRRCIALLPDQVEWKPDIHVDNREQNDSSRAVPTCGLA